MIYEWDSIKEVHDIYPPTYWDNGLGQRWVVVGGKRYSVNPNITLAEIRAKWVRPVRPKHNIKDSVHLVKSSNGKSYYTVTISNGVKSCTCTGYGFRRDCKHIRSITA